MNKLKKQYVVGLQEYKRKDNKVYILSNEIQDSQVFHEYIIIKVITKINNYSKTS